VPSFEYTSFVSLPPSRVASQQAGLPPARPLGARGRAWQQAGHLAYSHPAWRISIPLAAQAAAKRLSKF